MQLDQRAHASDCGATIQTIVGVAMMCTLQAVMAFAVETEYSRNIREATAVLEQVFKCEEIERYDSCYDLLSSSFKRGLNQDLGIKNREQYQKMREFRGLRWHSARITGDPFSHQSSVSFTVEINYDQRITGNVNATGRIEITATLYKEKGRWLLERWGLMASD